MRMCVAWATLVMALAVPCGARGDLARAEPAAVGLDARKLAAIEDELLPAIAQKRVPGAVVLVGRHGKVAYARALGLRAVEPKVEAMTLETRFDLASLTKPMATATCVMALVESGRLSLADSVAMRLAEFSGEGWKAITVEHLLRHRSGLIADDPLGDYAAGTEEAWRKIAALRPVRPPGERFVYSDVGFMVLGRIVERVCGRPLDEVFEEVVAGPLGRTTFGFHPASRPAAPELVELTAPTEKFKDDFLRGVVHDPRARALGGVAGHAGLFGSAEDVATFAAMMLAKGESAEGRRVLKAETVRGMTDAGESPFGERRGLGWDMATPYDAPRGAFAPGSYGHTGFTGTSVWIDPETDAFVVLLTSRLHPDGKGTTPNALRRRISTIVREAMTDVSSVHAVRPGIDVLIEQGFGPLRGKRVGLVTNHTGLTRDGRATIDVLHEAADVKLTALFAPEHGIRGDVDREIADGRDGKTGLPVFSLYGEHRRPTAESLKDVDVLVYDIQDIGARFYTYISTLGLVMEAAKERGIPLVVLDRPNPIGGEAIGGPVRDDAFESFIAFHRLPVRHGMTVGELAGMFNVERGLGIELTVIPCEGWRRGDLFDATGLMWVNPSPNMRSLNEALLYPGVALLEGTNLAVGRGTDTPFERIGAPWVVDPRAFASALNDQRIPGARFVPIRFQPKERQYAGVECGGVNIVISDRATFDPIDLGIGLATTLVRMYPQHWRPDGMKAFLADDAAYRAIVAGGDIASVKAVWRDELEAFGRNRRRFLIYDP